MKKYTVLVLRPDYERVGAPSEWVFQAHVDANSLIFAKREAIRLASHVTHSAAGDYTILAAYSGFLSNMLDTE